MKNEVIDIIEDNIQYLADILTRGKYFYNGDGEFDLSAFRKYQWRIYGKIELAYELDIITVAENVDYHKRVRELRRLVP